MARVRKKLSLDPKAAERGERYCELHSTSLSQIVSDFLSRLPLDDQEQELTPTVRRLLGAAKGDTDKKDSRNHPVEKYSG